MSAVAQLALALEPSPHTGAIHARASLVGTPSVPYEAGSFGRRTIGWRPPGYSANDAILGTLGTLRDRARAASRNNGAAKAAIDNLVSNLVGTGIKPLSQAPVDIMVSLDGRLVSVREAIQAAWIAFTDESDADGLLDFYGQQGQAVRTWLDGGESFTRIRPRLATDGLTVPLQVQILEPELCPYTYNLMSFAGAKVRAGIEFDSLGRRVAYYFHPSRPELDDYDRSQLRRVSSDSVCHLYQPLRPGQLRGLPQLTQALVKLQDLDKFDDAVLIRQQLQNLFAAFIKKDIAALGSEDINAVTGGVKKPGVRPETLTLEPGILQELEPGEDLAFSNPTGSPMGYAEYWRAQMRIVAISAGVPYELLTGDMSNMNDRTVRVVLNQFKRAIGMLQHQIIAFQWCRPIWNAFLDRAFISGAIPFPADYATNPAPYRAVKWTPPRWAYLHPVQDVEADEKAIAAGFTSRQAVVSEYGEDAEQIDAEQAADNKRADTLGLKYTSDGRQPGRPAAAAPAPPVDENAAATGAAAP